MVTFADVVFLVMLEVVFFDAFLARFAVTLAVAFFWIKVLLDLEAVLFLAASSLYFSFLSCSLTLSRLQLGRAPVALAFIFKVSVAWTVDVTLVPLFWVWFLTSYLVKWIMDNLSFWGAAVLIYFFYTIALVATEVFLETLAEWFELTFAFEVTFWLTFLVTLWP